MLTKRVTGDGRKHVFSHKLTADDKVLNEQWMSV